MRALDEHRVAGTHEGAITSIERREPFAHSSMKRIPSRPRTLAISCGSVTTVVVPRGTTARANSAGVASELSMWTCASMSRQRKPAASMRPISMACAIIESRL